ncbi:MAG TPA: hypothetical protein VI583_11240 [Cyclobacteriaceae bacterium]|nr:hypothetical protein [Cyclobacteriaceae bacterium]
MTESEFDLLDEIYLMRSYDQLAGSLEWDDGKILATLESLFQKGWIRCYISPTEEVLQEEIDLRESYRKFLYLASKEGLKAHNSNE